MRRVGAEESDTLDPAYHLTAEKYLRHLGIDIPESSDELAHRMNQYIADVRLKMYEHMKKTIMQERGEDYQNYIPTDTLYYRVKDSIDRVIQTFRRDHLRYATNNERKIRRAIARAGEDHLVRRAIFLHDRGFETTFMRNLHHLLNVAKSNVALYNSLIHDFLVPFDPNVVWDSKGVMS